MHRVLFNEMPIQTVIEVPLDEMAKLTAHKEQFFAGMRHPIAEESTQPREFLPVIPRHLADERTLSMDDLIMGERQDKVLRKRIHERKCDLVLIPLSVDGIEAHIGKHVVHPAHVPLVVKAHPAHVNGL